MDARDGRVMHARVGKAKPKVTAILRCRQYYDKEDLVKQFKTHVWCILEGNVGGFYHACDTILGRLDQVQESFERALDFAPGETFFAYNLIPLTTRRDIAMLGFIFRCAEGLAPEALQLLFPGASQVGHCYPTRFREDRHPIQLEELRTGTHHALLRRSVFGLVRIWNRLPAEVVMAKNIEKFQSGLTDMVRTASRRGVQEWARLFSPRPEIVNEARFFQSLACVSYVS